MANNAQFPGIQPLRPPIIGSLGAPQNALPPMPMQFQTEVPAQQSQPYIGMVSQQFQPVGRINIVLPPHNQQQFSQPLVINSRPGQPVPIGHGLLPPQAIPPPELQPNRPQIQNNYIPSFLGPRLPLSSSYTFASSSGGQPNINTDATSQYQPISQMSAPPAPGQTWLSTSQSVHPLTPVQQKADESSVTKSVIPAAAAQPNPSSNGLSDWIEHTARNKKRYYYNKRTRLSSWEKPLELMTPIERADATTDWKEVTSPDGRKYYYNKVTKQSKWSIPDELQLARSRVEVASGQDSLPDNTVISHATDSPSVVKAPSNDIAKSPANVIASSPASVEPVVHAVNPETVVASGSPASPHVLSTVTTSAVGEQTTEETETSVPSVSELGRTSVNTVVVPSTFEDLSPQDVTCVDGVSVGDKEEANEGMDSAGEVNANTSGDKMVDHKPVLYENKQEAKSAFKALLKSSNVESDWTWDQAMRVIINDQRYGALKTLGERKQAFNEFLSQKKKKDAEERRVKQKKAREDFKKMLEESKELTLSTRWSKAMTIFEDDERFTAVERTNDRQDLFEDYLEELKKKERLKVLEEQKQNRLEYVQYLKSCDFITASSQWRKVQDRLEADGRCSRLEKIDRLEIFQEYLRDLEKEEEEQRKLRMEELRKAERKNRDEFRKLMEAHISEGTLNAETHWRDYCVKVKDLPAYLAVSSNTSGSTAKDLFEDVAEELQKQYVEDKARVKDAVKLGKISVSSTWTLEDFRAAILDDISRPPVSDTNLKLVFDELQQRAREKEEKEAKKRKRLADDFYDLLCTSKEIDAHSRWDECKPLFEDKQESWLTVEESCFREIFDKYILELKEKAKEKERKRREDKARKEKEGKERERQKAKHRKDRESESRTGKERHRDGSGSENGEGTESYEENRRSGKHRDKRHRKRHISSVDGMSFDENERAWPRSFHRHKH